MKKQKKNVLLFMENKTADYESRIALGMKSYCGWKELTYQGLGILAKKLSNYLINEININKGDKIAILSESKPEWGAALFSTVLSGAIAVPLDIKLTIYELNSILSDCLPRVILTSSAYLETAIKLKEEIPSIEHIVIIDENYSGYPSLYSIQSEADGKWRHRSPNSTALIVYTSGTTGKPKGAEITFENMLGQMEAITPLFNFSGKDRVLSILPMNHLFELTVGFLCFLHWGTTIYYTQSLKPKDMFTIIKEKQITFMMVVPAFLKLLKTTVENELSQGSKLEKFFFDLRFNLAKYIPFRCIKKLMFKKIHKKFGGKFKGYISGGAPLELSLEMFFERIGMNVYQGYGLTEASPVVAVNYARNNRRGSVGKALSNLEAKTDEKTGELLIKGPSVMKGYHNRPDLTQEAIDDNGWLHTGDIAEIDKEGYIFITGRIKNMIVLSGGKKVFPEEVENVLEKSPLFSEVCVYGLERSGGQKDGTEDIFVTIVPKPDVVENAQSDEELEKTVKTEVKQLCKRLANYKRPINIIVQKEPLPKTATNKVKRKDVKKMAKEKRR